MIVSSGFQFRYESKVQTDSVFDVCLMSNKLIHILLQHLRVNSRVLDYLSNTFSKAIINFSSIPRVATNLLKYSFFKSSIIFLI